MCARLRLKPLRQIPGSFRISKWVWIFLIPFTITQIYCINKLSLNNDEPLFADYGIQILKMEGKKDVIYHESKLPVVALNMLPRAAEQIVNPGLERKWPDAIRDIVHGRYITLFFTLLLALLIYHWSRQLYSNRTALFSLAFYLLCPNFLAHGIFVSTDIYAAFFLTLSLYFLWRYLVSRRTSHFIFMSLAVAMAQISKFSMLHLLFIIPVIILLHHIFIKRKSFPGVRVIRLIYLAFIFLFINWLIISASHLFYGMFMPLGQYNFLSGTFQAIQQAIPWMPVPLPSSYVGSVDAVMYFDKLGGGVPGGIIGPIYMLGHSSTYGLWYYYLVAMLFKVPVPVLTMWLSLIIVSLRKLRDQAFLAKAIIFLLPVLYYLVYMSFFYGTQIGIRHIMIIFPLLYIFSGEIISWLDQKRRIVLIGMLAWTLISVLSYFPHFLPYTNEFVFPKKTAYRKISESNLSYGEGKPYLDAYLAEHKDAILHPEQPVPGKIIMEVGNITNASISTMHKYDWVKDLEPTGHIHSQYIIFHVTPAVADSLLKLRHAK